MVQKLPEMDFDEKWRGNFGYGYPCKIELFWHPYGRLFTISEMPRTRRRTVDPPARGWLMFNMGIALGAGFLKMNFRLGEQLWSCLNSRVVVRVWLDIVRWRLGGL